jgi:hypothetical protein
MLAILSKYIQPMVLLDNFNTANQYAFYTAEFKALADLGRILIISKPFLIVWSS